MLSKRPLEYLSNELWWDSYCSEGYTHNCGLSAIRIMESSVSAAVIGDKETRKGPSMSCLRLAVRDGECDLWGDYGRSGILRVPLSVDPEMLEGGQLKRDLILSPI